MSNMDLSFFGKVTMSMENWLSLFCSFAPEEDHEQLRSLLLAWMVKGPDTYRHQVSDFDEYMMKNDPMDLEQYHEKYGSVFDDINHEKIKSL